MRKFICICITLLGSLSLFCQESLKFADPDLAYRQGISLYERGQYLAAQKAFEEVIESGRAYPNSESELLISASAFYIAAASAELNDPDAESQLRTYANNYPESNRTKKAYFHLGKISYEKKRYTKAIQWFIMVDPDFLSGEEMVDYSFQLGYSYFIKKKFAEAKPLLKEVTAVASKYYYPSNYYYGFICFYQKAYDDALSSFSKVEESAIYAPVTPYYMAQIYYYKGQYDSVISSVREALDKDGIKYKKEMSLLIGKAYFEKKEYENAIVYLKAYVDNSRTVDETDLYQLGYAYYKNYEYEKAIAYLIELDRQTDSLGQNALYVLADCYMHTDDKSKARDAFQKSAYLGHDEAITEISLINYSKLSYELDFHKSAISTLADFIEERPDSKYAPEAKELLADVFLTTRNFSEALAVINDLNFSNPSIREAFQKISYYQSTELYNDGKTNEAIELLRKSIEVPVDPKIEALSHYLMGEIQFGKKNYQEAQNEYLKFLRLNKKSPVEAHEASSLRAYYNLGYCSLKGKDYADALKYFDRSLQLFDRSEDKVAKNRIEEDLLMRKADCHLMLKQYDEALTKYDDVIRRKMKGADYAMLQKATIQGLQSENNAKITTLSQLISEYPKSVFADDAWFRLGSAYQDELNNNKALNAFDQLIEKFPNSTFARKGYLKSGLIHFNESEYSSSIIDFEKVIGQYPESIEAREALQALKEVYVSMGNPEAYIRYVEQLPQFEITASEQDTILFQAAEENYLKGICSKAVDGLSKYVERFPNGSFQLEARFYRADCNMQAKNYEQALLDFQFLADKSGNKFSETALLKTSELYYYEFKNFEQSVNYLTKLLEMSGNKQNRQFALTGLMQSYYQLGKQDQTLEYADRVIASNLSNDQEIAEAKYFKGKIYFNLKMLDQSLEVFKETASFYNSEKGAESKYHIAMIYFLQNKYQKSLDECFEAKRDFSNYEYWIVKTFILMADNYFKLNNAFQAKATLESIIANFQGDKALVDQAKRKLDYIIQFEESNSKIEIREAVRDSIILMEDENPPNQ